MITAPIAITAGTGKIGSRVAQRLSDLGVRTRIGSRSSSPRFDWTDPSTWDPFVAGCSAAFVVFVPDLGFPGAEEAVADFGRRCRAAEVEHLVLLSGRGEPGAQAAERRLADVAGQVTVVRCSWFHQNFSESFLLDPVLDGVIALPSGDVTEPFVDADDIADVVVACLADYVAAACEAGIPVEQAHAFAHLFHEITDGRNVHLTGDVISVLGRQPRSFADYAMVTAATGVWAR